MSTTDDAPLEDVRVGIFLAPEGSEEIEFTEPKATVADAGATVDVLGSETGEVQTVNNDLEESETYEVEKSFTDVSATDYDALIVPGGPSVRIPSGPTTTPSTSCGSTSRPASPQA